MRPVDTEREAETSRLRLHGFGDEQHGPDVPANPARETPASRHQHSLFCAAALDQLAVGFLRPQFGVVASRTQPPAGLANITSRKRRTSIVR